MGEKWQGLAVGIMIGALVGLVVGNYMGRRLAPARSVAEAELAAAEAELAAAKALPAMPKPRTSPAHTGQSEGEGMTDADRKERQKAHGQIYKSEVDGSWQAWAYLELGLQAGYSPRPARVSIRVTGFHTEAVARREIARIARAAGWPAILWS